MQQAYCNFNILYVQYIHSVYSENVGNGNGTSVDESEGPSHEENVSAGSAYSGSLQSTELNVWLILRIFD